MAVRLHPVLGESGPGPAERASAGRSGRDPHNPTLPQCCQCKTPPERHPGAVRPVGCMRELGRRHHGGLRRGHLPHPPPNRPILRILDVTIPLESDLFEDPHRGVPLG